MDELLSDFLSETKEYIEGIETYLVLFEQILMIPMQSRIYSGSSTRSKEPLAF